MSNIAIPNLTAAIALTGAELVPIVQAGSSARATVSQIAALAPTTARIPAVTSVVTASPITPSCTATDQYEVTALASSVTVAAPSGTPSDGQKLMLRFKDNGTPQTLTWTTTAGGYRAKAGTTLPTTTSASTVVYIGCIYNSQDNYWDVLAVGQ
jgi:hypothetical protein